MNWTHNKAIKDVKKEVMQKSTEGGCECPVCGQFVKVYKRGISETTAHGLAKAYIHFGNNWFHMSALLKHWEANTGGEFARLRFYGLIEEMENENEKTRTSGFWRVTKKGYDFITDKITVQKYGLFYDGRCLGFEGEEIRYSDIYEAFDYKKLMESLK